MRPGGGSEGRPDLPAGQGWTAGPRLRRSAADRGAAGAKEGERLGAAAGRRARTRVRGGVREGRWLPGGPRGEGRRGWELLPLMNDFGERSESIALGARSPWKSCSKRRDQWLSRGRSQIACLDKSVACVTLSS